MQDRSINQGFRFIALVYLGIGLYVLLRRWTAPHSTHFYLFCLVSFVLYSFWYTGKFNEFDWHCLLERHRRQRVTARALSPFRAGLFRRSPHADKAGWPAHLSCPALSSSPCRSSRIEMWSATELLAHRLDQVDTGYKAVFYLLAAAVFYLHYREAEAPLERQQLKWLTRGTLLAVIPFTLLYAIPYMADFPMPDVLTKLAGICMVFLPLTFSWAIVRYRMMDVDLIFKRGVTYTLATAALVGVYFSLLAVAAALAQARLPVSASGA